LKIITKSLYAKQVSTASEEIFSSFLDNKDCLLVLTEDKKALYEGSLSKDECYYALKDFPNGKSPGNDGLTSEFYKTFWPLLGQLLTDSFNYSFAHGELSNSQMQAVIRLVEKKNRDRRLIKNWRPISLLNVDAKIASKALASRLVKILPHIINEDQYAYVKGRTIFDAVRTIDDIMEFPRLKQLPGLLVAFDFEKAFV